MFALFHVRIQKQETMHVKNKTSKNNPTICHYWLLSISDVALSAVGLSDIDSSDPFWLTADLHNTVHRKIALTA